MLQFYRWPVSSPITELTIRILKHTYMYTHTHIKWLCICVKSARNQFHSIQFGVFRFCFLLFFRLCPVLSILIGIFIDFAFLWCLFSSHSHSLAVGFVGMLLIFQQSFLIWIMAPYQMVDFKIAVYFLPFCNAFSVCSTLHTYETIIETIHIYPDWGAL